MFPYSYLGRSSYDGWVSVLDQHLNVLREPSASLRRTVHSAHSVTLAARLHPDNAVDVGVVRYRRGHVAEAGLHIAPLTPFRTRSGECYASLVDDEP